MENKPKITGQIITHNDKFYAVWLVDGHKHSRQIYASNRQEANEQFKELMGKIKSHFER